MLTRVCLHSLPPEHSHSEAEFAPKAPEEGSHTGAQVEGRQAAGTLGTPLAVLKNPFFFTQHCPIFLLLHLALLELFFFSSDQLRFFCIHHNTFSTTYTPLWKSLPSILLQICPSTAFTDFKSFTTTHPFERPRLPHEQQLVTNVCPNSPFLTSSRRAPPHPTRVSGFSNSITTSTTPSSSNSPSIHNRHNSFIVSVASYSLFYRPNPHGSIQVTEVVYVSARQNSRPPTLRPPHPAAALS